VNVGTGVALLSPEERTSNPFLEEKNNQTMVSIFRPTRPTDWIRVVMIYSRPLITCFRFMAQPVVTDLSNVDLLERTPYRFVPYLLFSLDNALVPQLTPEVLSHGTVLGKFTGCQELNMLRS